jgi:hypothetical protein
VIELVDGQPAFEEGPSVDPRGGVALVEDLVATPLPVLALEEVVEPHLVQGGR